MAPRSVGEEWKGEVTNLLVKSGLRKGWIGRSGLLDCRLQGKRRFKENLPIATTRSEVKVYEVNWEGSEGRRLLRLVRQTGHLGVLVLTGILRKDEPWLLYMCLDKGEDIDTGDKNPRYVYKCEICTFIVEGCGTLRPRSYHYSFTRIGRQDLSPVFGHRKYHADTQSFSGGRRLSNGVWECLDLRFSSHSSGPSRGRPLPFPRVGLDRKYFKSSLLRVYLYSRGPLSHLRLLGDDTLHRPHPSPSPSG